MHPEINWGKTSLRLKRMKLTAKGPATRMVSEVSVDLGKTYQFRTQA